MAKPGASKTRPRNELLGEIDDLLDGIDREIGKAEIGARVERLLESAAPSDMNFEDRAWAMEVLGITNQRDDSGAMSPEYLSWVAITTEIYCDEKDCENCGLMNEGADRGMFNAYNFHIDRFRRYVTGWNIEPSETLWAMRNPQCRLSDKNNIQAAEYHMRVVEGWDGVVEELIDHPVVPKPEPESLPPVSHMTLAQMDMELPVWRRTAMYEAMNRHNPQDVNMRRTVENTVLLHRRSVEVAAQEMASLSAQLNEILGDINE